LVIIPIKECELDMQHTYSLKQLKVLDEVSDETICFQALLVVDGKSIGVALNGGHGGPNEYRIDEKDLDYHSRHIEAWVDEYMRKAYADIGEVYTSNPYRQANLDILIGELIRIDELVRIGRRLARHYAKEYNLPFEEVLVYRHKDEVLKFHRDLRLEMEREYPKFKPFPTQAAITI